MKIVYQSENGKIFLKAEDCIQHESEIEKRRVDTYYYDYITYKEIYRKDIRNALKSMKSSKENLRRYKRAYYEALKEYNEKLETILKQVKRNAR